MIEKIPNQAKINKPKDNSSLEVSKPAGARPKPQSKALNATQNSILIEEQEQEA